MYNVEGFEFETKEQALQAKKEVEGVRYIKAQMQLDEPEVVRRLYQKLIAQNVFETPVGLSFLSELKQYLQAHDSASRSVIKMPSHVEPELFHEESDEVDFASEKDAEEAREARKEAIRQEKENIRKAKKMEKTSNEAFLENQIMREKNAIDKNQKKLIEKYRKRFQVSLFFAIVFAVAVIGMFVITFISKDNVNILNYENALIDRYESWEADLQEREAAIQQKEAELGITGEE